MGPVQKVTILGLAEPVKVDQPGPRLLLVCYRCTRGAVKLRVRERPGGGFVPLEHCDGTCKSCQSPMYSVGVLDPATGTAAWPGKEPTIILWEEDE